MPFKLKLKKTRQYNVASKSLFVISVELLDGGVADCTLSVDSTGQECLDNVCQRQAINQPEFFGLRYANRNQQPRWVQLDRPLKRQLDKYASSHQLYLRVMYYVISGTSLITDEVTRYHYFLQLKNDLIEGRIICDCQQAVVLASYSRQAEYGNHDRERHTVEYLKNLLTFPKQILDGGQIMDISSLADTGRLEWLTASVIQHHMSLHNMTQAQAEEGFITTCQQLRGYGQEMFSARDHRDHSEVTLAISLTGIRVLADNSDTPHYYRWQDITNVINHKRTFSIECGSPTTLLLPSPDDGKYVWRMCVMQHTFYMKHRPALAHEPRPIFQEHGLSESREELDARDLGSSRFDVGGGRLDAGGGHLDAGGGRLDTGGGRLEPLTSVHRARSTSCLELPPAPRRPLPPSYRPAPDYDTAVQQKYRQRLRYQQYGSHPDVRLYPDYPDVARHTLGLGYVGLHYVNVYKPPPPYGLASSSTPDLSSPAPRAPASGSSPDLVRPYLPYVQAVGVGGGAAAARVLPYAPYQLAAPPAPPAPPPQVYYRRPEPIYENVPPWRGGRERARSLTAADDRPRPAPHLTAPAVTAAPSVTALTPDDTAHYVNAQVIRGVRESSLPKELNGIPPEPAEDDETPYQSLSAKVSISRSVDIGRADVIGRSADISRSADVINRSADVISRSADNVTCIAVSGPEPDGTISSVGSELENSKASNKEKKRRRWGVFMGRGRSGGEEKSATLGRDRPPTAAPRHRWSTGQHKQPLPPSITKETLCQILERKMSDEQLSFAFSQIPQARSQAEWGAALSSTAGAVDAACGLPSHRPLPYEDNRVRLTPTPQNPHGYINASHVTMTVGSSQRFYVVVAGASPAALWECAWQTGARLLAVVSPDPPTFLPPSNVTHQYGQTSVSCGTWARAAWGGSVRVRASRGRARTLCVVHYSAWPAAKPAPPDVDQFLEFLSELSALRVAVAAEAAGERAPLAARNPPVLFVGRCGLALAADLLTHVLDANQELDIPHTITTLHQQRAGLIDSEQQYRCLHQLLLHYLRHSRLI